MSINLTSPIFHDDVAARAHLEAIRWPNGAICAHCNSENVKKLTGKSTRPGVHWCNACEQPFTVTVGTVMERSKIPLAKWVLGFHLMAASKKGVSSHQLHRMLGITYKSAWFLSMRIRDAMNMEPESEGGPDMGGKGKIGKTTKPSSAARPRTSTTASLSLRRSPLLRRSSAAVSCARVMCRT